MFLSEWPFPLGSNQFLVPQGHEPASRREGRCAKDKLQGCHPIPRPSAFPKMSPPPALLLLIKFNMFPKLVLYP